MAYIEGTEDEEKRRQADGGELQLASGQAGQAQAGGAAPAPASTAPVSQNAGQTPGRFVNFERYFNANRDAAMAAGNKLAEGIEKQGQTVQGQLANQQTAFGTAVTAGMGAAAPAPTKVPTQSSTVAPVKKTAAAPTAMPTTQTAAAPASAPTKVQYAGPNSLSEGKGWAELLGQASKTNKEAQQTATNEGRQALFQQQQGPGYSAGQSRFDAGLTGATSGDRFAKLRERFGGLSKQLEAADTASRGVADAAKSRVGAHNAEVDRLAAEKAAMKKEAADKAAAEKAAYNSPEAREKRGKKAQEELAFNADMWRQLENTEYRAPAYRVWRSISDGKEPSQEDLATMKKYMDSKFGSGVFERWLANHRNSKQYRADEQAWLEGLPQNQPQGDTRDPVSKAITDQGINWIINNVNW